jgi:hypothetical protein
MLDLDRLQASVNAAFPPATCAAGLKARLQIFATKLVGRP